jgi:hypothetical protein
MTSKEKQREMEIDELGSFLEIVYTAFCMHCSDSEDSNQTEKEFSTKLHDKGWRVSDTGDVCCPKCAKIHCK